MLFSAVEARYLLLLLTFYYKHLLHLFDYENYSWTTPFDFKTYKHINI